MFELKNKTILILSPQAWGTMFISKHHYAVELAKKGNNVYFLNPPEKNLDRRVIIKTTDIHGLNIIDHEINFPYSIKFHAIKLFHFLMQWQVKKIIAAIGNNIDIIWSFDSVNLYPLELFSKKAVKIYHPVDEPSSDFAINAAKGADIIFSVTTEILEKFNQYKIPKHFVNHGVITNFFPEDTVPVPYDEKGINVGFSGNLLRPDIDTETLLQIFTQNPAVVFECWGSYKMGEANIGGGLDKEKEQFIRTLKELPNVILHGAVPSNELAFGYRRMNAFLICYDIQRDQSKGTNYHKIMEYLASGKVIISNNVTTYKDHPELLQMTTERDSNRNLPVLFKKVIENIDFYNSEKASNIRIDFARNNLYTKQLLRIEDLLQDNKNKSSVSL